MLSGIGPAETLKSHGIPVMLENEEVGSNMKDHLCTTPIIVKVKDGLTLDYLANEIKALPALARWYLTGGGPLASNAGEAAAFYPIHGRPLPSDGECSQGLFLWS
jgi:choline dehydrogenase